MSSSVLILLVVGGAVLLALLAFTTVRRRDVRGAGALSRETVKRDRDADLDLPTGPTGREVERAAHESARGSAPAIATVAPPALWVPPDREEIGVSRRQFLNRASVTLMSAGLGGFAAASFVAFLWPTAAPVFGGKVNVGKLDDILMRVTDIYLAFPFLVAIIVIRQFLGQVGWITAIIGDVSSFRFTIFLITLFGWMGVARLVRGSVLSLKEREFVEAARAVGASNTRIAFTHLLPNSIGPILVAFTIAVVGGLVVESTLSFFGLGPQPGSGNTSLGKLIELSSEGAKAGYWWLVVYPCGMLVLLAVCINFIGDGLRDAFDPKLDKGKA